MSLLERVKNIILRPGTEWPVIAGEPSSLGGLYAGYVAPLAAINPVALFIGLSIVGIGIPFVGTYRAPLLSGVSQAVLSFVLALAGVLLAGAVVNFLAPAFGGRRNFIAAVKLVAYSATPSFVAGVLSIFPPLAILELLAAAWGIYVFYVGVPVVMNTARSKALAYTAVTFACLFVLGIVLSVVFGTMVGVGRLAASGVGTFSGSAVPAQSDAQAKAVAATIIGNAVGGAESDKKEAAALVEGVAQAAKSADSAQASGDAAAQAQAGVNMLKSLVTAGKNPVTPVAREELKALLPASVAGRARTLAASRSQTFAGIAASGASATYGDERSGTIELGLGDLGNLGGLALLANAGANLSSSDSDEGYAKTVEVDGRKIHERWTAAGKHSELFEIVDDRFAVTVEGSGVDMDVALDALRAVDVARLERLRP